MHGSNVDLPLHNESRSDGRTAGTMNDPMNAQFTQYQEQIVHRKKQQHQQQLAAHHLRAQQQLVQQQLAQQQQNMLIYNGIWFRPYPSWNWGKKRIVKLGVLLLVEDSNILFFFFHFFFLSPLLQVIVCPSVTKGHPSCCQTIWNFCESVIACPPSFTNS